MVLKLFVATCGLLGLFALTACGPTSVQAPPAPVQPQPELAGPEQPGEVRVGLLLPLTGPAASLGQDMLDAAQMALFDVGQNEVVLLPRDTAGSAAEARAAAEALIVEGVSVILGPLYSQAVEAVGPVAAAAGVPVLAFSNVTAAASPPTTFVLGFRPEAQVRRVVEYALAQGLTTIAGLAPDDAYGRTAIGALQDAVIAAGGNLGDTLLYPADAADPSAMVREVAAYDRRRAALEEEKARLAGAPGSEARRRELEALDTFGPPPFDAILIADFGSRLQTVAALLTFFDVTPADARFLGTMRWLDDPSVLQEDALAGGWFAGPAPGRVDAFERRFNQTYGRPPQQLASLAYDAAALAVIVARDLNDPAFNAPTLTQSQGFDGATGLFRLRPDGLAEHGLAVLEVTDGGLVVVDSPPARFDDFVVETDRFGRGRTGGAVLPASPPVGPSPALEGLPEAPSVPVDRVIVPERTPPPAPSSPSSGTF